MLPDVIVIGGGVIGLSCALRLAQDGRRVTLLERSNCGQAASHAGAGIVDAGSVIRTDALAQLRRASVQLYPSFCEELRHETGIDPEYWSCGAVELLADASQARAAEVLLTSHTAPEAVQRLSPADAARIAPGVALPEYDALWRPQVAQVRNPRLLRALRHACQRRGVDIREGEDARDVDIARGARIEAVRTAPGTRFAAGQFVLAAGAWSGGIAERIGAALPVRPVRGQMLQFECGVAAPPVIVLQGRRYVVPRRDGAVLVGSTEEHRAGFDVSTTAAALDRLHAFAAACVPPLGATPRAAAWAGLRPASADGRPYLGRWPRLSNLLIATGHFRSGLTLAPITAQLVSDWCANRTPTLDTSAFDAGRVLESEASA